MEKRAINPTPWLQHFGLNHAVEVKNGQRVLYLSGQTSSEADGSSRHPGDIVKQFEFAWSNLKDALAQADMGPANIVRLNIYTTDMDTFMASAERIVPIWANDNAQVCCTLLGVARLFDPDILVEIEATAVA
jgi:enamine deaminase RidA (YjgF/YER057c/UK114 family)